jgi:hypothetical protein
MSAALIQAAAAAGVQLTLNGDKLVMKAKHKPPSDLLAEIKAHKPEIVAALQSAEDQSRCKIHPAWWPLPHPRVILEPPFGLDRPPAQLRAAWIAVCLERPPDIDALVWEVAMFNTALLFGDWGRLIEDYRWTANDLFGPDGLAWAIKSRHPVTAVGKNMASMRDGQIWLRWKKGQTHESDHASLF